MKRLLSLLLCLTLCLTVPAMAAGPQGGAAFPQTLAYSVFPDVPAGHWAEPYVRVCVQTGLMKGMGGWFSPDTQLNNAQVATLAARIHCAFHGGSFSETTTPWYQGAYDYLARLGIQVGSPFAYTTRQGFFNLLSAVVPREELAPINKITALPDTNDPNVLIFYNAGILTGVDSYGTFDGSKPLTRAQCAAMTARIADPTLRRAFTPAGQVPAGPFSDDEIVMTVDGQPVTYGEFLEVLLCLTEEIRNLYMDYGLSFDWDHSYGVDSWCNTLREATCHSLAARTLFQREMDRLGCTSEEALALALFGAPTQAELTAKAASEGMDRTQPETDRLLTELIWQEKLDRQMNLWVDQAEIVTTPVYGQIDPHVLWEMYNP